MTAAHDYEDLHALVDRLSPDQARDLRAVALRLVEANEGLDHPDTERSGRRRLSFIGTMNSGVGDLAERHEEILREGLNRPV
ncbi:hypothetical protein Pth03_52570 [Planotetraspora thailandica]|uniref:Uncharacterized protein n=1 Tax=Planotetraspora thailandica TaxID=487172 RepID=A0A8J3XZ87_9ACTN|nr:hypothetical protein [Planotetraspora thailandica]GII56868.1 hypothetical protein Pth03_52570 [Planotetraspora thailandica]